MAGLGALGNAAIGSAETALPPWHVTLFNVVAIFDKATAVPAVFDKSIALSAVFDKARGVSISITIGT